MISSHQDYPAALSAQGSLCQKAIPECDLHPEALHTTVAAHAPYYLTPTNPTKHTTVTHDRNVIVPSKRDRNHALILEGLRALWCEMNIFLVVS